MVFPAGLYFAKFVPFLHWLDCDTMALYHLFLHLSQKLNETLQPPKVP